ncbi:MAG: response regulator transcription factor [Flavobacteriales bacterium]|nr:response regulator transcription factor [Flavobacteriales bacterium]
MAEPIRVLIVDDHAMFADGIRGLLDTESDILVKAIAHTGESALKQLIEQEVDVVLLDINLPDMDGIQVCKQIKEAGHVCAVIGLSMHEEEAFITRMLEQGAMGYLLKSADKVELINAIRAVHNNEFYYSKQVTQTLIDALMDHQGRSSHAQEKERRTVVLSEREQEVLQLIAEEWTTGEIAEKLSISHHTVETHRRHLLEKLDARNTAGMIRAGFQQGFLK